MKIFFIVSLNNVANINSEMYKNHFILNPVQGETK